MPDYETARLACRAAIAALECADYAAPQREYLSIEGSFSLDELKKIVALYETFLNETR